MKQTRRANALKRLQDQLISGVKPNQDLVNPHLDQKDMMVQLTNEDTLRIKAEIQTLKDTLEGRKKTKKEPVKGEKPEDKMFIDIYTIKYGYVKQSERRKNKGKSRKGLKKVKTKSFLRTVTAHPGLLTSYKEGKMGLSPKLHSFVLRKEEEPMY